MSYPVRACTQPDHDPALLAFVKCHVTSFARWDLLRLLATNDGRWIAPEEAAHDVHKSTSCVASTLQALSLEGLIEQQASDCGVAYRMDPLEPSTLLVERLVQGAKRSQELRQIIVARVLGGERIAH